MKQKLRMTAISDIHYPSNSTNLTAVAANLTDTDILGVVGDIGSHPYYFDEALRRFSGFDGLKVAVLGNHDFYVSEDENSYSRLETLERVCTLNGFILLDKEPIVYKGVGFVGNVGWYDYSFAQKYSDEEIGVYESGKWITKPLDRITQDNYAQKSCLGAYGVEGWADRTNIHWIYNDLEFLELQLEKLDNDLKIVTPSSDRIVYLTHHIPIEEFIIKKRNNPVWSYLNAFQGSPQLGALALQNPLVSTVVCGHSHLGPLSLVEGNVAFYDISRELGYLEPTTLEV